MSLPTNELACNIIKWSEVGYTVAPPSQGDAKSTPIGIYAYLDEGALVNTACYYGNQDDEVDCHVHNNVGCPKGMEKKHCFNHDYALRDIAAGEELQISYGGYVVHPGWRRFGL